MAEQTPLLKEQPPPEYPPPSAPASAPPSAPPPYQGAPYQGEGPYQPPQQPPVVTTQPVVVTSIVRFADVPVQVRCPNCHRDVMTNLQHTTGMLTWLIVLLLCVLGFWCGCCLIPLCVDGLKDVDHICPNCNYTVGKYKRLD